MQRREHARAHDREDGHGLCEAVDARAPLLSEQEKNGGNQSSRVTDTDPPDEVRDVPSPSDGATVSPYADAAPEQPTDGDP